MTIATALKGIAVIGLALLFYFCDTTYQVQVREIFSSPAGPALFEATDGTVSVTLSSDECSCPKEALQTLADSANRGDIEWPRMTDHHYRHEKILWACKRPGGILDVKGLP